MDLKPSIRSIDLPSPHTVWPKLKGATPVKCAALFVDLRGSSAMSAKFGEESITVARRTQDLLELSESVWRSSRGQDPDMVRSYGDGLFLVWELPPDDESQQAPRMSLLKAVLQFNRDLPKELKRKWGGRQDVFIGMALTAGDASVAELDERKDYYGSVINLAAKLQNFARPHGAVIDESFHPLLKDKDRARRLRLSLRHFTTDLAKGKQRHWCTPSVQYSHGWTCLAWPGFASSQVTTDSLLSLNARGITVLEHEGLQGKIGSMQVWPQNSTEMRPAVEIIIDDFDNLLDMHRSGSVRLVGNRDDERPYLAYAISSEIGDTDFFFEPIRCGLNALAFNLDVQENILECKTYKDVLEHQPAFKVGIYDNMGATLPVLFAAACPKVEDVFEYCGPEACEELLNWLTALQGKDFHSRPLFHIYRTIKNLARQLQGGRAVDVVLGGGAWLANPLRSPTPRVGIMVPQNSQVKGFVWIEGAAIFERAQDHSDGIRNFLTKVLLSEKYQMTVINGVPYGSIPVSSDVVQRILDRSLNIGDATASAKSVITEEMSFIFQAQGAKLSPGIHIRRAPRYISDWLKVWSIIKDKFCRKMEETN